MASEVDPLILRLQANTDRYRAEIRSTATLVTAQLGRQEKAVKSLETQFQRSSGAIGSSLKGLAATFAGAFTAKQLQGVLDDFTRLQNSLRVAGLEGEALAGVQSKLLGLSTRYGVSINELANLYGKSAQAASDLGASEEQLLQLTEASAQALKITGTSAVQAQGALLGLTQALASGTVRAEEFNQINEGGLRPLLQVAANTERFGGSVAKLRLAVVDGKVSSQEFYAAILAGSEELDAKASKATLTLAGAFEALSSRLTVYMGEASAANGVTAALSGAIGLLADNIEVIIPALAVLVSALGIGFVTNAIAARVAAQSLGASLLSAFGGPVGLAITGITVALGFAVTEMHNAANAGERLSGMLDSARSRFETYESAAQAAGVATDGTGQAAGIATGKFGILGNAISVVSQLYKNLANDARIAAIAVANANIAKAQSERADALGRVGAASINPIIGLFKGYRPDQTAADIQKANAVIAQEKANIALLGKLPQGALGGKSPKVASGGGGGGKAKKGGGGGGRKGRSGPSAGETEQRFYDELANLAQRTISAQSSIAASAEEKAELELRSIELAKTRAIEGINSEKNYTDAQKKRLLQQIDALAFEEQAVVEYRKTQQLEQEKRDLANQEYEAQSEALKYQFDLADSQAERRRLALDMIDLDYRHKEALLQAVIASEAASDAEREYARRALEKLQGARARDTNNANRDTMGPAERYLDELRRGGKPEVIAESAQQAAVDGLQSLNDQLVDAIMNSKSLGQAFSNVAKQIVADLLRIAIQRALIEPLANALFPSKENSGGGLGGFFSNVIGSIGSFFGHAPARASGGRVDAGTMYRVNEANQEFFRPDVAGQVIPLSKMRAQSGGSAANSKISLRVEMSEDLNARIDSRSSSMAVEVVRIAAPTIRDSAVQETFRRGSRPGFR